MQSTLTQNKRIDVADVLRAVAVGAIFLLHSIEHFNFYKFPDANCEVLRFFDTAIWDSMFFTFAGKSYAIFALLFGFSFFIQSDNQNKKGKAFTWRFVWRLLLLLLWGNLNAAFFTGEVLVLYALLGITLLGVNPFKSKTVLIIAVICMLQPYEWYKMIYALANPDFVPGPALSSVYFANAYNVLPDGTFWETVKMNLYDGQIASLTWAWDNGRFFQTASLFMLGLLAGRHKIFYDSELNTKLHIKIAVIALICFFPLHGLRSVIPMFVENRAVATPLLLIVKSLSSFAFMLVLVSGITLLFYKSSYQKMLLKLAPYGKMSLTNYIMQSVIGSMLYYGWGFAMYKYLGITYSFILGIVLLYLQYRFSVWWMASHRYGPLEGIWHKLTWIGKK